MTKIFVFSGEILKYYFVKHKKNFITPDDYYYSLIMKNQKKEIIQLTLKTHKKFYNNSKYFIVSYKIKNDERVITHIKAIANLNDSASIYKKYKEEQDLKRIEHTDFPKPFLLTNHKKFIARDVIINKHSNEMINKCKTLELHIQKVLNNDRYMLRFSNSLIYDYSGSNSRLLYSLENYKRCLFLYRRDNLISSNKDIIDINTPSYLINEESFTFFKLPDLMEIYKNTEDYKEIDNISKSYREHLFLNKQQKEISIPNQATKALLRDHFMFDKKLSKRKIEKEMKKLNIF